MQQVLWTPTLHTQAAVSEYIINVLVHMVPYIECSMLHYLCVHIKLFCYYFSP